MNSIPKISVIVPIYKVEKYLRQCIDSILNQTLKELEIILVDDGSPDKCPLICDEYAQKDSRVIVIHKENAGLGAAYNTGIRIAKGQYIGFVEPDDWIEPEMYEVMYKNAIFYNTDATKCGFWEYNSINPSKNRNRQGILGFVCNEPKGAFKIEEYPLLCAYHSSIWSYIYKSEFVKKIKFVETKGGAAYVDAPFGFEVLCKANRLSIVPRSFYHWRLENHGNSVSITDQRVLAMADRFLEAKDILKRTGKYHLLKEIFYLHARNANYGHFLCIDHQYKRQYFAKLRQLFGEIQQDPSFHWLYLGPHSKKWIQDINNNHFIASQIRSSNIIQDWRKFFIDIHINFQSFTLQFLGIRISNSKDTTIPAWITWDI